MSTRGTQNCNESFNNVLWAKMPKRTFIAINTLELCVFESVISCNEENLGKCKNWNRAWSFLCTVLQRKRQNGKSEKCSFGNVNTSTTEEITSAETSGRTLGGTRREESILRAGSPLTLLSKIHLSDFWFEFFQFFLKCP
ncbi:hypothetical protein HHI36_014274, partial [Cryptolaemus montrouzieri]